MPTVKEDLVSGHTLRDEASLATVIRTFHVTGLTDTPQRQLMEAIYTPGIPLLGELYPIGDNSYPIYNDLYASARDVEPYGCNAAKVTVTYATVQRASRYRRIEDGQTLSPDLKTVETAYATRTTTRDAAGDTMVIQPPPGYENARGYPPYTVTAEIEVPIGVIRFSRSSRNPLTPELRLYEGKLNSSSLGGNYAAKTVRCMRISDDTNDGGRTYVQEWEFHIAPDVEYWQHEDVYRSRLNQVVEGSDPEFFDVIPTIDFGPLGFDWSDSQTPL